MKKIIFACACILFIACRHETKINHAQEQESQPQEDSYDTSFRNNVVYPAVRCSGSNEVTYALLLPDDYDTISRFPVIFFIDAHADGALPLEKYKTLASHYGYIFIGNNNSKNGNSLEANAAFVDATIKDAVKRFSINKNRIYVSGFSGGSRVAGYVVQNNILVKGAIACGAGMAVSVNLAGKQFIYIGIAGNEDFNYTEMKRQDADLNGTGIRHELLTFDGKHEWCPAEQMSEAITGLEMDAMKTHVIPVKQQLVDDFVLKSEAKTVMLEKLQRKFELFHQLRKMINFLDGLYDISKYRQQAMAIESTEAYMQEVKAKEDAETKEAALKDQYVKMFSEKDENWWSNEILSINKQIITNKNKEEALIQKRILSYLSLAAFSYSNNAMNQNNFDAAIRYLNVYKIIDPPNSEHSYMLAEAYSEKQDAEKSISFLKDAVKLGFKDSARLEGDAHFNPVTNLPAFSLIVNEIKSAK
ncbi:MAG: hypothetical protein ABIT08_03645 [Bacteroidia bacterium]